MKQERLHNDTARPGQSISMWASAVVVVLLIAAIPMAARSEESAATLFAQGMEQFEHGAFEAAIVTLRKLVEQQEVADEVVRLRAQLAIAAACQRIGLYREAKLALSEVESSDIVRRDPELTAQLRLQAGNLNFAAHRYAEALENLSAASAQAALSGRRELHALVLNDYGNALAAGGYATDAIAAYTQARESAVELNLAPVALAAAVNLARAQAQRGDGDAANAAIAVAENQWRAAQPTFEWAMAGLALVELRRQSGDAAQSSELAALSRIEDYATRTQNPRLLASVNLSRGESQDEAALRKAIFFAAQSRAPDVQYEAHWRLAQLLRRQGRLDAAIESFEHALSALSPIRDELMNGPRDSQRFFQRRIRPVYTDFVDALMTAAAGVDPARSAVQLERARNTIEALRGAELQDYFRDECVTIAATRSPTLNRAVGGVAVVYPIVLAERVELLLTVDGKLSRYSVDVTQEQLNDAALRLREFAEDDSHERFMPYAIRLHRWLIDPLRVELENADVETLVVVPDGVLRTVPFAVLHDGERFLIEDFAVAVTPALRLTALAAPMKSSNVLLAGVAQSVQGFAPLPEVATELQSIRDRLGGRVLADDNYTKANLQAALSDGDYNIVHMATHGTVSAATADSFLLTYDGRLTMTDLETALRRDSREPRIDLLTLSGCETAVGDERAALGLAGMAVKSGAASVLASLWKVDDAATARLMDRFYEQLQTGQAAKARALRSAQLSMLADVRFSHPAHWAAFMLIGSWQ